MFNRIRGLFQRFERRHRYIQARGFALSQRGAPLQGYVDRVVLEGTRLTFVGWCVAGQITFTSATGRVQTRPDIVRQDVASTLGVPPLVGFEISLPYGPGPVTVTLDEDSSRQIIPIRGHRMLRHRLALIVRFGWTLLRLTPAIAAVLLRHDPAARTTIKNALGLQTVVAAAPLDTSLFEVTEPAPVTVPITVVLPVYNAFDLLPEVLDRVINHTDLPWHLIVIEDCSSDPAVRPWLRDWVAAQSPEQVELIENTANKGFIGSVNAGLTRAAEIGNHVVLLNSDAFVPAGWASRLLRPIVTQDNVASVTPMSNDAEIFTVPLISQPTELHPGQGDVMDALAQGFNPITTAAVPTGVGFCMAMNIDYIRKTPLLDPVFGRGYGEEVDWCQKTRALGGRHLALPGLFVEHRGGTSFGSDEKLKLVLKNNQIIASRYAGYDAEVQDFIAADPLVTARLALAITWAAGQAPVIPIYLAHSMGGGADHYLERRIADDLAATGTPAVILRVGGMMRWQIELVSAGGRLAGTTDDFELVQRLLAPLNTRRIVYSCGVGDPDPITLPDHLLALKRRDTDQVEVLVHDFFMVSPSYTLLDQDGTYRGPVTATRDDPAHATTHPNGSPVALRDWMAAWSLLLTQAEIVVFSADSRAQMLAAYPDLDAQLVLRPHDLLADVPLLSRPNGTRRVIGVLGNIGHQKGAAVVADLGRLITDIPDLGLVIIGNVDPTYMPPASVPVHGDYQIKDLTALATRYGITDWLIPSIWPETFSYTTHECLATGLPTYAFDIGAQGEAVARAKNGHVIGFDQGRDLSQSVLDAVT